MPPSDLPATRYQLRVAPLQHRLHVCATFTAPADGPLQLMLPVWTPGSYVVRDYARHIETLQAHAAGRPLPMRKVRLHRWEVDGGGAATIQVEYVLYCRELSVRSNFVDDDFALLVGAATFLTQPATQHLPHRVEVDLPIGYARCVVALPTLHDAERQVAFEAANFDALVDAPIYLGSGDWRTVQVEDCSVEVLTEGADNRWDLPRAAADIAQIVATQGAFWGGLPMRRYVFFNLLTGGHGGLEHAHCAVLMADAAAGQSRAEYLDWLFLVSHELFHAWNVKRLRPAELGPFDYEAPCPTAMLWVAEGFTAYYDALLVRRAGLCSTAEYLERLAKSIARLAATPGEAIQSLCDASYDAWIKFYRRDDNSDNATVSYYLKGSLLAFVLDARVRQHSAGACSLDDIMRQAFLAFGGARGYSLEQFCSLCSRVAGCDLQPFFAATVSRAGRLSVDAALTYYGLAAAAAPDDPAAPPAPPKGGYLGLKVRSQDGRHRVVEVVRDAPAFAAGINADDELLAVDGQRLPAATPADGWRGYAPGSRLEVTLVRRGKMRCLSVVVAPEPGTVGGLWGDGPALRAWLQPRSFATG